MDEKQKHEHTFRQGPDHVAIQLVKTKTDPSTTANQSEISQHEYRNPLKTRFGSFSPYHTSLHKYDNIEGIQILNINMTLDSGKVRLFLDIIL